MTIQSFRKITVFVTPIQIYKTNYLVSVLHTLGTQTSHQGASNVASWTRPAQEN